MAAKAAKKSGMKAPKGGVKKRYRYRPGTVALKGDQADTRNPQNF